MSYQSLLRFIEDYDLRITDDEIIAKAMNKSVLAILKEASVKTMLAPVFTDCGSKYKPDRVAQWISEGFLNRKSLKDRIKNIDEQNCRMIASNYSKTSCKDSDELYSKIVKTRNYYSHFKLDDSELLSFSEINNINLYLEGCIIAIFLDKLGVDFDMKKRILGTDEKYVWIARHLLS